MSGGDSTDRDLHRLLMARLLGRVDQGSQYPGHSPGAADPAAFQAFHMAWADHWCAFRLCSAWWLWEGHLLRASDVKVLATRKPISPLLFVGGAPLRLAERRLVA